MVRRLQLAKELAVKNAIPIALLSLSLPVLAFRIELPGGREIKGDDPLKTLNSGAQLVFQMLHTPAKIPELAFNAAMAPVKEFYAQANAPTLEAWIRKSRDDHVRAGVEPIPATIRAKLKNYYPESLLDHARYRVGITGDLSLPNSVFKIGGMAAIVLDHVIVFSDHQQALNDDYLWAHEMAHVQQYRDWGITNFAIRYTRDYDAVEAEAAMQATAYLVARDNKIGNKSNAPGTAMPSAYKTYFVKNKATGKFLDVYGANQNVGGQVVQADWHRFQSWRLIPSAEYPGYYYLQANISGLCLDVFGASKKTGGKIVQAAPHKEQVWSIKSAEESGYAYVTSKISGLNLDVYGASEAVGTPIVQASAHPKQVWTFISAD